MLPPSVESLGGEPSWGTAYGGSGRVGARAGGAHIGLHVCDLLLHQVNRAAYTKTSARATRVDPSREAKPPVDCSGTDGARPYSHAEAVMMKVFIGGSRRVSRLDEQVRGRLDEIIRKQLPVIIGDANGADKAVQDYFRTCGYEQVEVFCTEGRCRNNMGNWKTRPVPAPAGRKHDFEYYQPKIA